MTLSIKALYSCPLDQTHVEYMVSVMSLLLRSNFIKQVLKNVIKRAFGELNNVFQDEINTILSQQSTNVRFFLSHN